MKLILTFVAILFATESYSQACSEPNSLVSVRKRKSGRTEYVIFTMKNPVTATTTTSNATPPFHADGSGNIVNVRGCRYKKVKFESIEWTCKVRELFSGATYLVRQVKSLGQFEGQIEYVIGYRCNTQSVVSYSYQDGGMTKYVVRLRY
jgi:hypothetical protein